MSARLPRSLAERLIGCAAPIGLDLLIDLVLAYLHVGAARRCDLRRVGMVQHLPAVCGVCHLQTPAEARIRVHFIVYNTGGLLRQKDHMDTQRPANREHAIDRLHEFREPVLEFRELAAPHLLHRLSGSRSTNQCGKSAFSSIL